MLFNKPFVEINDKDIERLVNDEVREGRQLDYKAELPGRGDPDKRAFVKDLTAFANGAGGYIIYGVTDKKDASGKNTGIPELVGLPDLNADQEILRMESIARGNIDPVIPGLQMKAIGSFSKGPVILVHIPRSWQAPHMITVDKDTRFWTRGSGGNQPMDVREIRSAFLISADMATKIRRFRDERLGRIMADDTPVMLDGQTRLVLHVIPFSAMSMDANVDLKGFEDNLPFPVGGGVSNFRYNFDGFLTWKAINEQRQYSYLQVFRTGALESVSTTYTGQVKDGRLEFYPSQIEEQAVSVLPDYLSRFQKLGIETPIVVLVSLLNVKGATVQNPSDWFRGRNSIDRDTLLLPDILLQEYPQDLQRGLRMKLRPAFDALWQACGVAESPSKLT